MVLEKIKTILSDQFDVEEEEIFEETNIEKDLGADSLDIGDLLVALEEEFNIEIDMEDAEDIKTVKDLVLYIEKKIR